MSTNRMLIVGGGIAGLSLVRALRDGPWQVQLAERDPAARVRGAGIAIQPNAMRVLARLGLSAAVERAGTVLHHFQYRDHTGAMLCEIDLDAVWGDTGAFVGITRAALREALCDGPVDCAADAARLVRAVQQRHGRVTVSFADHMRDSFDLVVGADGISSAVRGSLARQPRPDYAGQMVWRSVAASGSDVPEAVQFWLGADRFFGLCPAGAGLTYGFGNLTSTCLRDPVAGRKERLAARFADFGAPVRDYIAAIGLDENIHCAPIEVLPHVSWGAGRVALIGDAAHAMSPMMGQGGCMAIEDAFVLADELHRDSDALAALDAFAARRTPRVNSVRQQSHNLADLIARPPTDRDTAVRRHGATAFRARYRPLITEP